MNNNTKQVIIDLTLTKCQDAAYKAIKDPEITYLVLRYSRQIGKTIFAELMLIEYLLQAKSFNIYISPTYSQGVKVFSDLINIMEPTGLIKKANAQTLRIETVYKSVLQFYSMANPTAVRGSTVKGILVLDEVAFFPDQTTDGQDPWQSVIFPTIKANIKNNKVLAISTPAGSRGIFYDFHLNAMENKKGWKELKFTIYDDDLASPELIEEIKNTISPTAWKQEFLVEFLDSGMSFFYGFEKCFTKFLYDDKAKQWLGIDLSGNGKDQTIVTKINDKKQVKQITITGTLDQKYRKIADIINNTKNLKVVFMENNGLGLPIINEVKKLVNNNQLIKEWNTNNKNKVEILCQLATDIANKDIIFDAEDTELYAQFGSFICKYTKHGNMQLEAMNGRHDDKIMSLAIALKAKNSAAIGNYTFNF